MSAKNKIALGTVQFGMNYGISNSRGQIPAKEILQILKFAFDNKIDTLDTAYSYGESEKIIGESLKKLNINFKIISKLPDTETDNVKAILNDSLKRLKCNKIYGYLIHDFKQFDQKPGLFEVLLTYKQQGFIEKVGFSLYKPEDLEILLVKNIEFDIVQIPYNIFDRRFEGYFQLLKEKNVEIHVRSVYLQGLFFIKPEELNEKFKSIKQILSRLNMLCNEINTSIASVCLNFVLHNTLIDNAIIGVECIGNLKENITSLQDSGKINTIYSELLTLIVHDEKILLPYNWN